MDWLSFISSIIDSIVWPVTILILVYLLRNPLSSLIPLLQKLKYKDLELEFGRRIEEAKEEAEAELPPTDSLLEIDESRKERLLKLASISPRATILDSWREIELSLLDAAERNKVKLPYRRARSPLQVMKTLQEADLIDKNKIPLFEDLRILRNQAAHSPDFTLNTNSAIEYSSLAFRFADYIKSIKKV
tara:strand:+ start:1608 stop:2174 length:567 start_codon:yes stop_codon:yes gene_type:complete